MISLLRDKFVKSENLRMNNIDKAHKLNNMIFLNIMWYDRYDVNVVYFYHKY